jgi:uncharacterized membrane protein YhaH (DUF805 family)
MGERMREGAGLVTRTIGGTFAFTGRSRRLEVAWYWLFSSLAGAAAKTVAGGWFESRDTLIAHGVIDLLLTLPWFALFARRLHDQGRSAWWVLLMPPLLALSFYKTIWANFNAFDPAWPDPDYWPLAMLPAAILLLVFCLAPGEIGQNRYGADPRVEGEPSTSLAN